MIPADATIPLKRMHLVMLGLILLLAGFLRSYRISYDSLWTDEFFSLELSTARGLGDALMPLDQIVLHPPAPTLLRDGPPWHRVWLAMRHDTHPPLHPLMLRFWRATFGEGEIAARSLSAVFSILAIIFLFIAMRFLHGPGPALWAALVMAVAAPQIEFAQFVRGYSMLIASVAACCAIVAWIVARGATLFRCVMLSLALIIAMLTHYGAAGPLAGIILFAMTRLNGRSRFRVLITTIVSAIIYVAIWSPFFFQQRSNFTTNMSWTIDSPGGHLQRTLMRLARLPMRYFFEPQARGDTIAAASAIFYVLPLLLIRRNSAWLMWWLLLVGAVVPVLTADLRRASLMLNMPRYTIAGSIAAYAMVGAIVELRGAVTSRFVARAISGIPAIVAIACALTLPDFYQRRDPDFRDIGQYLATRVRLDDTMLIVAPTGAQWTSYVLQMAITQYAGGAQCPMAILTHPPDDAMISQLRARTGTIWIVGNQGPEMIPGATFVEGKYFPFIARVSAVRISS